MAAANSRGLGADSGCWPPFANGVDINIEAFRLGVLLAACLNTLQDGAVMLFDLKLRQFGCRCITNRLMPPSKEGFVRMVLQKQT